MGWFTNSKDDQLREKERGLQQQLETQQRANEASRQAEEKTRQELEDTRMQAAEDRRKMEREMNEKHDKEKEDYAKERREKEEAHRKEMANEREKEREIQENLRNETAKERQEAIKQHREDVREKEKLHREKMREDEAAWREKEKEFDDTLKEVKKETREIEKQWLEKIREHNKKVLDKQNTQNEELREIMGQQQNALENNRRMLREARKEQMRVQVTNVHNSLQIQMMDSRNHHLQILNETIGRIAPEFTEKVVNAWNKVVDVISTHSAKPSSASKTHMNEFRDALDNFRGVCNRLYNQAETTDFESKKQRDQLLETIIKVRKSIDMTKSHFIEVLADFSTGPTISDLKFDKLKQEMEALQASVDEVKTVSVENITGHVEQQMAQIEEETRNMAIGGTSREAIEYDE